MSAFLNVDFEGEHPYGSGVSRFPSEFRLLYSRDGTIYDRYRGRPTTYFPRVVRRRFRDGQRRAFVVSTYLGSDLVVDALHSVWPIAYREYLGADGGAYGFVFRTEGGTLDTVNGRDHRVGPLQCYLVRYVPGVRHVLRSVTDRPLTEIFVGVGPQRLAEMLGMGGAALDALLFPDGSWYSETAMTPEMLAPARRLLSLTPDNPVYRLAAEAVGLDLVSMFIERLRQRRAELAGPRIESIDLPRLLRVRRHLDESWDRVPQLDDLAKMVGVSRSKLTRDFRREFGQSVLEYHHGVRMDTAKALLQSSDIAIDDVAHRVGYEYPSNFAKAFARHTGLSPHRYRAVEGRISAAPSAPGSAPGSPA